MQPEILQEMTSKQYPVKSLDISSTIILVVSDLLKAHAILSDTTVRRSAIDQEDLKPRQKSEKRSHF